MKKLNDITIEESLKKDGVLSLYYVTGTDAYLIDRSIHRIVRAALGEGDSDFLRFTPKTLTDGEFTELFYSFSLLGEMRVALVEDFNVNTLPAEARALLGELLTEIPDNLVLIFSQFSDDRRYEPSNKALDFFSKQPRSAVVAAMTKEGAELRRYIQQIAKAEGCAINDRALQELTTLCGEDLLLIQSEIKKLAGLANYTEITEKQVEAIGVRSAEIGVYRMLSALERGKTAEVMAMLGTMLDDRTESLAIVAVVSTAFVNLYCARLVREQRKPLAEVIERFNYKKGDRKISIAYDNCMKYAIAKLERILGILCDLEMQLKSSPVPHRTILEQKMAEICLAVSA